MTRKRINLLLAGLMCLTPLSSFFSVICHGSDGHVAVEVPVHSHCACPEPGVENNDNATGVVVASSSGHGHCNDTALATSYIVTARRDINFSIHHVFLTHPVLKSISSPFTFFFEHSVARSNECTPFFTPLRTVILLV